MMISGRRADGAVYVSMGGGIAVIVKGWRMSPPLDDAVATSMGPWTPADNSHESRRVVQKALDLAYVSSIEHFINLGMSFDERRERVVSALRVRMGMPMSPYGVGGLNSFEPWIPSNGLGEDWVVYSTNGKYYGYAYDLDETTGTVTFEDTPVEVRATWESMSEDDDSFDKAIALSDVIALKRTAWFKNFMASKKKNMKDVAPDDEAPTDEKPKKKKEVMVIPAPEDIATIPDEDADDEKKEKSPLPFLSASERWRSLWDSAKDRIDLKGTPTADKGEHPFTYCKQVVIPSMAKAGKEPDDPDAFCSWYKHEGPGSE